MEYNCNLNEQRIIYKFIINILLNIKKTNLTIYNHIFRGKNIIEIFNKNLTISINLNSKELSLVSPKLIYSIKFILSLNIYNILLYRLLIMILKLMILFKHKNVLKDNIYSKNNDFKNYITNQLNTIVYNTDNNE